MRCQMDLKNSLASTVTAKMMSFFVQLQILSQLVSKEEEFVSNIVVEVLAGVGGQEAMLFAEEIHSMYSNYIAFNGWTYEMTDLEVTDLGVYLRGSILGI